MSLHKISPNVLFFWMMFFYLPETFNVRPHLRQTLSNSSVVKFCGPLSIPWSVRSNNCHWFWYTGYIHFCGRIRSEYSNRKHFFFIFSYFKMKLFYGESSTKIEGVYATLRSTIYLIITFPYPCGDSLSDSSVVFWIP